MTKKKSTYAICIFFSIVLTAVIVMSTIFYYFKWHSHTATQGRYTVTGLQGAVDIYRDENGVPHITAYANDDDAYFALGFVHAQDRFWQMEFQRRVVKGRLSELFGSKTVDADKYLRTLGFYRAAESAFNAYDQRTQHIIESYTAGVNAFIKLGKMPLEVSLLHDSIEPWTVIDSIAWQKMMAWNLQQHSWLNKIDYQWVKDHYGSIQVERFFPDYAKPTKQIEMAVNHDGITHDKQSAIDAALGENTLPGKGSNGWVVSGSRTASQKPLLANDIHLSFSAPMIWYLVEMRGPTLHVTGASIPGMPGIATGHNDDISWGVTSGYNDAADLMMVNAASKLQTHEEIINVRFGKPVKLTVNVSEDGPIINDVIPNLKSDNRKIALKWPALLPGDTTIQSFIEINYAKNWDQFVAALKNYVTPTQAFIYADTQGNTGFYYPGRLPIRKQHNAYFELMAEENRNQSFIPFEQLPHQFNPASGEIVVANYNVVDQNYPYSLNDRWPVPPYRVNRIKALLQNKNSLTVNDMIAVQADNLSTIWLKLKPLLLTVKAQNATSKKILEILTQWDGHADVNSKAATLFAYWVNAYNDLIPEPIRQPDKVIDSYIVYSYLQSAPLAAQKGFDQMVASVIATLGNDSEKWNWGRVHQADFPALGLGRIKLLGLFLNRSIETPGSTYTVNAGTYDARTLHHMNGASYRQIIDLADLDNSLFMIPMGQSGNPFSNHYDDLLQKWVDMQYIKIKSMAGCRAGNKSCLRLIHGN